MRSVIIGTAGHIDHGKTALVKALTGVDTDRLPEEKARGITIDIGFAHRMLSNAQISFIDVPGHERFIRNMLAGIGGIDLLMLIVAADESVMPQTREHFDICRLLNIPSGLIVLTKKDLVDQETLNVVKAEVTDLVRNSFLQNAPIVAVSAKTGEGVDVLTATLNSAVETLAPRPTGGFFRMPIDRVFVLKGHGTVVTGTLLSGAVRKESAAEILPSHIKTRIRSIHAHDKSVESAFAGQRTALNLQGLEKDQIHRGDVLTIPDVFENTSILDVKVSLLENAKPLLHNATVRFHHLTTDTLAKVSLLEGPVLEPGKSMFAQLRLQKPVFAIYGDHFILRRHSPLTTIAGGVILDHLPPRRIRKSDAKIVDRFSRLEEANTAQRLSVILKDRSRLGADQKYLVAKMALPPEDILALDEESFLILRRDPILAIDAGSLGGVIAEIKRFLENYHRENPLLPGVSKEEIRTRGFAKIPGELFTAILDQAIAEKQIQVNKEAISLYGRTVTLSRETQDFSARVEDALLRAGLELPRIEEWAQTLKSKPEDVKKILHVLVRQEKAMKIDEDYFLHRKTWEELKQKIRALKATQKSFSVPDFKTLFGVTRKYAIPLLERLDREGVTRRSGNERIII